MRRPTHRTLILASLVICASCAAEPGDPAARDESVGSSEEDLTVMLARPLQPLRVEERGTRSLTLSYPCGPSAQSLWRREGNGTYRKVTDLPRCSRRTRREYVDRDVRPVAPYCYRLGTRRAPSSLATCTRTLYARCGAAGRPWRRIDCDGCTVRVPPGSCLDIRSDAKLDPRSTYDSVEIKIARSHVDLDCQGATLEGAYSAGSGVVVESPASVTFDSASPTGCGEPPPPRLCTYDSDRVLGDVQVRHCNVDGYDKGVRVLLRGAWSSRVKEKIIDAYAHRWFRHPTEQMCRVTQLENCLRAAAPHDVELSGVHIRDTAGTGLSLESYVHDVTFRGGSVHDADGVGAYVTYGSRDNVIRDSSFRNNGREGIALDASSFNWIFNNRLEGNSDPWHPEWENPYGQAITVYRNAWENRYPEPSTSAPRVQHAEGNRIENNHITNHEDAIWIGYRQSTGRHSSTERGDPVYWSEDGIPPTTLRYYRKNAEDTVVRSNFISDFDRGVVVEDDGAIVTGNSFDTFRDDAVGVDVGSRVRRKAREPVHSTTIENNSFIGRYDHHIHIHDCAYGERVRENYALTDGEWLPLGVHRGSCTGRQAQIVAHLTAADGAVAAESFSQRGAFFHDGQTWLAGDVDDDGLDDVVDVQWTDDNRVRVWLHVASGDGFEHQSSYQRYEELGIPVFADLRILPREGQWILADLDDRPGDDLAYVYGHGFSDDANPTHVLLWSAYNEGFMDPVDRAISGSRYHRTDRWSAGRVDDDLRADLIQVRDDARSAEVLVHRSEGDRSFAGVWSRQAIGAFAEGQRWLVGDVSGDGLADLVTVFEGSGGKAMVWAHHSTGSGFELDSWLSFFSSTGSATGATSLLPYQHWLLADVDGDDLDDLVVAYPVSGNTVISKARSTGSGLSWIGTDLLRSPTADHVWLSGRFDCGPREDLVSVGPAPAWGRVTDVVAPAGAACREVLPVGGILVSAGTFAGG